MPGYLHVCEVRHWKRSPDESPGARHQSLAVHALGDGGREAICMRNQVTRRHSTASTATVDADHRVLDSVVALLAAVAVSILRTTTRQWVGGAQLDGLLHDGMCERGSSALQSAVGGDGLAVQVADGEAGDVTAGQAVKTQ